MNLIKLICLAKLSVFYIELNFILIVLIKEI